MRMFWQDDESDSIAAEKLSAAIEQMSNRSTLKRFFILALALTVINWVAVLVFPAEIRDAFETVFAVSNKLSVVVLGFAFGAGMFLAYALLRFYIPDIEEQSLDSDMMGTFAFQSKSVKRWRVWVMSTGFGVLNLILLVAIDLWLTS